MSENLFKAYERKIEILQDDVQKLLFENPSWEVCKKSDDITVSRMPSPHAKTHAFKIESIIAVEIGELSRRINPLGPYRTKWDSTIEKTEILQKINENNFILRHFGKPQIMGLISARDSVDLCSFSQSDECRTYIAQSVETSLCPPDPSYVRVCMYSAGTFLYPTADKNQTKVVILFNSDLNLQLVPTSVAETFVPRRCVIIMEEMKKCGQLKDENYETLPGWS